MACHSTRTVFKEEFGGCIVVFKGGNKDNLNAMNKTKSTQVICTCTYGNLSTILVLKGKVFSAVFFYCKFTQHWKDCFI